MLPDKVSLPLCVHLNWEFSNTLHLLCQKQSAVISTTLSLDIPFSFSVKPNVGSTNKFGQNGIEMVIELCFY